MLKEYPKRKLALHFKYDDWRSPKALNVIKFLKPFNQQVFLFDMSLNFCETMKKTDDSIVVGVSVGDKHYHDGFTNIEDAINVGFDGFTIATPAETHYDIARKIIESQHHV